MTLSKEKKHSNPNPEKNSFLHTSSPPLVFIFGLPEPLPDEIFLLLQHTSPLSQDSHYPLHPNSPNRSPKTESSSTTKDSSGNNERGKDSRTKRPFLSILTDLPSSSSQDASPHSSRQPFGQTSGVSTSAPPEEIAPP